MWKGYKISILIVGYPQRQQSLEAFVIILKIPRHEHIRHLSLAIAIPPSLSLCLVLGSLLDPPTVTFPSSTWIKTLQIPSQNGYFPFISFLFEFPLQSSYFNPLLSFSSSVIPSSKQLLFPFHFLSTPLFKYAPKSPPLNYPLRFLIFSAQKHV